MVQNLEYFSLRFSDQKNVDSVKKKQQKNRTSTAETRLELCYITLRDNRNKSTEGIYNEVTVYKNN